MKRGVERTTGQQLSLVTQSHRSTAETTSRLQETGRTLRVAGLFAGIGGIERGLRLAGHEASLLCENDAGASEVLAEHFGDVARHDDIRTLRALPKEIDLVAAGFPCQDLSQAGNTKGLAGARSGLVGEVFRLLDRNHVPWVLLENVSFMLQLGKGGALEVILGEFERLGYRWAYRVVDTRAFGLPQRRERVFILAARDDDPRGVLFSDDVGKPPPRSYSPGVAFGFYWTEGIRGLGAAIDGVPTLKGGSTIGIPSPPAILLPNGDVVKPDIRDAERLQGFPSDWTLPALRSAKPGHRWKLVGNAVTVDVAEWIGRRLSTPAFYDGSWDDPLALGAAWPIAAWNAGDGRRSARLSSFPFQRSTPPLHEFLRHEPTPLSAKATAGFLSRTARGSLRFPRGFLSALESHLERMKSQPCAAGPRRGEALVATTG